MKIENDVKVVKFQMYVQAATDVEWLMILGKRRTKDPINVDYRVDGSVARNKIAKIVPRCNGIRSPFLRGRIAVSLEELYGCFTALSPRPRRALWRVTGKEDAKLTLKES